MNRLERPLDGLLHLMDRQVVDSDGKLVCKCDDLELSEVGDGGLVVTGLLVGAPVLVPRLGTWLHERWRRLGGERDDRLLPYRIDLRDIERVTQEIVLRRPREGFLSRQQPGQASVRRLAGDVLGARVIGPDEGELGRLLDMRLEPGAGGETNLRVTHLLVGRGRPGSYLGYDRSPQQGPWLLNKLIRRLHRHSGMVPVGEVEQIDWQDRRIHVRAGLGALSHVGTTAEPRRGEGD